MSFYCLLNASVACMHCGNMIPEDEMNSPSRDTDGDPLCDVCYRETYEFQCSLCGETEEKKHQHNVMIVFESGVIRGQGPGLYQIIHLPYYMDGMITGYVIESALKRVGPLPKDARPDGYPAGHLCQRCIKQHVPSCSRPKVNARWD